MRAVLIGNPIAGRKVGQVTNALTVDDAIAALREAGVEPEVWLTQGPGDATGLSQRALEQGYETIVAAGGDGTVQEVAQPLVNSEANLGVMPLGSVMNLARTLGIHRNLAEAARVIHEGRLLKMDVGEVNGRYFLEYAGVGIDAALYPLTDQIDKGQWSSLRQVVEVVLRFRPLKMTLAVDGKTRTIRALMIVIANTPYFGPAVELNPEAKVNDHRFDIKIFDRFSRVELLTFGLQIARGSRPYHPKMRTLRGRNVAVSSSRPLPAHADIERIGSTPVMFRLIADGLRVWANPALWQTEEPTAVQAEKPPLPQEAAWEQHAPPREGTAAR